MIRRTNQTTVNSKSCTQWAKWTTVVAIVILSRFMIAAVDSASDTTSIPAEGDPLTSVTPPVDGNNGNATASTRVRSTTPNHVNTSASTKASANDVNQPQSQSHGTRLVVGLAMGFGFTFGLIIAVCIIWRCCCRMMRGNDKSTSNKVAPQIDLPGRQPLGGGGGGSSSYTVRGGGGGGGGGGEEDGVSHERGAAAITGDRRNGGHSLHLEID